MSKQKILMLKGLPASGKSTFAKELVANDHSWKRVNRDSLRKMFAQDFNEKDEKLILRIRDHIITEALKSGYNVVIDDLNISPKHEKRIRSLISKDVEFEISDSFLSVPLNELLNRNANREDSVPEKVIKDLYAAHIDKTVSKKDLFNKNKEKFVSLPKPKDPNLPDAIIVDIDGTVALMQGRSPFDWEKVHTDYPNYPIIEIVNRFRDNYEILFVSGREDVSRVKTEEWLADNVLGVKNFNDDLSSHLFMRQANDQRKDSVVKEEIYNNYIKDKYNIEFVLDDRNQTVQKWRELELTTLQVSNGNF